MSLVHSAPDGRCVPTATDFPAGSSSSTAKALASANNGAGEGGEDFSFLPDETGFDVWRLDCAVENLRSKDLSQYRKELARIAANFADLMDATK